MVRVAQLVRALDCGSKGRGFKSHRAPLKGHPFGWPFFLPCRHIAYPVLIAANSSTSSSCLNGLAM